MKNLLTRLLPIVPARHRPSQPPPQVLQTTQDETFAEFLRLTAKLFQVPVVLLALAEEGALQVGCAYGLDAALTQTKLLGSLALLHAEWRVVENLHAAPCELLSPCFSAQRQVGFYASHRLRTQEGQVLGVLCLLDYQPRTFHPLEVDVLTQLATLALSLLDLRLLLLQQPTGNQQLWQGIAGRLRSSTSRLKTLAALARWEEQAGSITSPTYQHALYEEVLHLLRGLTDHLRIFQS